MINRLVAENAIKTPFRGDPYFSLTKKLLCFQSAQSLKIKTLTRETKDIEIPTPTPPTTFALAQSKSWLFALTPTYLLEIYQIDYINGITEGSHKKIAILHNVETFK
jgi:hypothetical protein